MDLFDLLRNFGWKLSDDEKKITRMFIFDSFKKAFSFMTLIALHAESLNHHPEWFNVYNQVEVTFSTHDIDGLSENDLKMARICCENYLKF